ncbi:MAG: MYXO-CTERM sorting domain-containing protein, partial [Deltaproteobacteria bacterium]|nr:MYXO-CTERM sorting domain-containing protein [Deltaproteobacteria bacterium]
PGVDGGAGGDSGMTGDAGPGRRRDSGCGCAVPGGSRGTPFAGLVLFGLALAWRRRRR